MTKQELFHYAAEVIGIDQIDEYAIQIETGLITTKQQIDSWSPR